MCSAPVSVVNDAATTVVPMPLYLFDDFATGESHPDSPSNIGFYVRCVHY